jgi:hypothetical protein
VCGVGPDGDPVDDDLVDLFHEVCGAAEGDDARSSFDDGVKGGEFERASMTPGDIAQVRAAGIDSGGTVLLAAALGTTMRDPWD